MVSNEETISAENTSTVQKLRDVQGPYRWLGLFLLFEVGLLVLAVFLDKALGTPLIGGLIATVAVIIAICFTLTAVGLAIYRVIF